MESAIRARFVRDSFHSLSTELSTDLSRGGIIRIALSLSLSWGDGRSIDAQTHPQNAPGDWYVDTRCIDCGAARTAAPGLIVERGGQSVFARPPQTADERMMAWRARLLCPTASVRSESHARVPDGVFPEQMTKEVYRLGYNAKSAYGAHSFAIRRPGGNVMLDGPRFTR